MLLEKTRQEDVLLVSIAGEFDTLDVDRFAAEISEAIDAGSIRVALELERLNFINSTALGSLLREQKRLHQAGGDLACAALSPFAAKNFRILGLDRRIRCFAKTAEAVAYLRTVGTGGVSMAGDHRVAFSFADAPDAAKETIAELRDLHEGGLTFVLENFEGVDVPQVFRAGRPVKVRFSLPLYHPTHEFRIQGVLGAVDALAGKRVSARVAFDSLGDVDRAAIQRFVEDVRFIREEVPPEGGGAGAGK